ncbi:MAG: DUF4250 domain-containing protein [Clostridiales bacterium]|nr:DUF4250 domain-containing protein [Clostridiales bacterium]
MLLSFINTQLRDNHDSLDDLCSSYGISREELERKLSNINYTYDESSNRFV